MRISILLFSMIVSVSSYAQSDLSVEEIINLHLQARGGAEKLRAIGCLVYRGGTYHEGDYVGSGKAYMAFMKPFLRVVGNPEDSGATFREGYDGSAWEWFADPGVVLRTVGPANRATRHGTDFLGPFLDYHDRGTSIELQGIVDVAERPSYDLLVTLRDGFRRHYFVDAGSFLITAQRYDAPVHAFGEIIRTEARLEDYRPVDGILFPFRIAEYDIDSGAPLNRMQWASIETRCDFPRSWFSPPEFDRTPLQILLENLYVQRTDVSAVLWSLIDFRQAYPDIDVKEGLEFIGYQMIKMGDHDAAIALLQRNVGEHPESASALFTLGRAYRSAQRSDDAIEVLRKAVELDPKHRGARKALAEMGMAPDQ